MKLIGSTTSPFVRRIRLLLADDKYDFTCVNIFSEEGQKVVAQYTTTGRIPLLIDGATVIWDSFLITRYLLKDALPLDVQKDLVLVDDMTDSGIQLFQLRKFETDPQDQGVFSRNNLRRIGNILDYFEARPDLDWDVVGQWLYCTLDWFEFRDVVNWKTKHPRLKKFYLSHQNRPEVQLTDPRSPA